MTQLIWKLGQLRNTVFPRQIQLLKWIANYTRSRNKSLSMSIKSKDSTWMRVTEFQKAGILDWIKRKIQVQDQHSAFFPYSLQKQCDLLLNLLSSWLLPFCDRPLPWIVTKMKLSLHFFGQVLCLSNNKEITNAKQMPYVYVHIYMYMWM